MSNIRLPSGKIITAYGGIVGIDEDLNVYGGFDQQIDTLQKLDPEYGPDISTLSRQERYELANRMICLWTEYRHKR
jgi:hypothetical protein